jgi:hypothetical protein
MNEHFLGFLFQQRGKKMQLTVRLVHSWSREVQVRKERGRQLGIT